MLDFLKPHLWHMQHNNPPTHNDTQVDIYQDEGGRALKE